jgi:hypothetical protein
VVLHQRVDEFGGGDVRRGGVLPLRSSLELRPAVVAVLACDRGLGVAERYRWLRLA